MGGKEGVYEYLKVDVTDPTWPDNAFLVLEIAEESSDVEVVGAVRQKVLSRHAQLKRAMNISPSEASYVQRRVEWAKGVFASHDSLNRHRSMLEDARKRLLRKEVETLKATKQGKSKESAVTFLTQKAQAFRIPGAMQAKLVAEVVSEIGNWDTRGSNEAAKKVSKAWKRQARSSVSEFNVLAALGRIPVGALWGVGAGLKILVELATSTVVYGFVLSLVLCVPAVLLGWILGQSGWYFAIGGTVVGGVLGFLFSLAEARKWAVKNEVRVIEPSVCGGFAALVFPILIASMDGYPVDAEDLALACVGFALGGVFLANAIWWIVSGGSMSWREYLEGWWWNLEKREC